MSITYKIQSGDTFELIARKQYGIEVEARRIAAANPGLAEPLTVGTVIAIPILPNAPQNVSQAAPANNLDEVSILVDGTRFRFWDSVRILQSIDAMDTVEFGAPFEPDAPGFRETFRPFSFKPLAVSVGGEPLFTGTMVSVLPTIENTRKTIQVGGYSLPGVLNDCTPPASSFPLEFNGQTLKEIAAAIAAPFGLSVEFEGDPGPAFDRVALEPAKKALTFLTELAKQRNFVIGSSPRGALRFLRSTNSGQPVARLQQGSAPVIAVAPEFNPQEYYSHITGIEPVLVGLAGSQFTVKNSHLPGVIRPLTFAAPDTLDSNVKEAVDAKLGRMFGGMAAYSISIATWRDPGGQLWKPNTKVTLLAPGAMVYSEYEFIIRSIQFERTRATESAVLNLVIPGSFSGETPESLPWD